MSFTGLFYGGGIALLAKQLLGVLTVCAWTAVTITIMFLLIRATVGLRVTREEEIMGLDLPEHGLANAYAGFVPAHQHLARKRRPAALPLPRSAQLR